MLKKNDTKMNDLPDESPVNANVEDESLHEDEFDGPINPLELENDDFDDWHPELEKIQRASKPLASKPAMPSLSLLDKKQMGDIAIPPKFICALSKQIMTKPVRIAGSKVPVAYEESAIIAHYDEHGTDPMTEEDLGEEPYFMPDLALTREISDFCLAHRVPQEKSAK